MGGFAPLRVDQLHGDGVVGGDGRVGFPVEGDGERPARWRDGVAQVVAGQHDACTEVDAEGIGARHEVHLPKSRCLALRIVVCTGDRHSLSGRRFIHPHGEGQHVRRVSYRRCVDGVVLDPGPARFQPRCGEQAPSGEGISLRDDARVFAQQVDEDRVVGGGRGQRLLVERESDGVARLHGFGLDGVAVQAERFAEVDGVRVGDSCRDGGGRLIFDYKQKKFIFEGRCKLMLLCTFINMKKFETKLRKRGILE